MTINQAVLALRKHLGKSRQVYATELGMSISSLINYEHDRLPQPRQLFALERSALEAGRQDLAKVFRKSLAETMGPGFPAAIV